MFVRTKEIQLIDPLRRKSGIIYLHVSDKKENPIQKTVTFEIILATPKTIQRQGVAEVHKTREDGSPYIEFVEGTFEQVVLEPYRKIDAIFRVSRYFQEQLNNLTPEEYAEAMINQIDAVNKLTPTGNEVQTEFFFYNWTKDDLELVTEEEVQEMAKLKLVQ